MTETALEARNKSLRELIKQHDGNVTATALFMGISERALRYRLRSQSNRAWWFSFKKQRSKRLARERARRWREKNGLETAGSCF